MTPPPRRRGDGQHWDAGRYARNARFVADLAAGLVDLLAPRPGMRVLDVGCGDGAFSARIAERGAEVVGIDPAPDMVRSARARGIEARVCAAADLDEEEAFDAAASNAVFHWIRDPGPSLAAVRRALRPGGRFVGEMGGAGNIASVTDALDSALARRGLAFRDLDPWNFPTAEEWTRELRAAGFEDARAELFARPTPLPSALAGWLDTFAGAPLAPFASADRAAVVAEVEEALAPRLRDADGVWTLDYVRLRFAARRPLKPRGPVPN